MEAGAHILVFPYPAQGHMLPLLDLTHQLAIRGLAITILVTPKNQPLLQPLLSTHPSIETLVMPFPTHPYIPPGVENLKDMPGTNSRNIWMDMMCALRGLHDNIERWFQNHSSPPLAIISDMFLGWTHRLACRLGIRRYVFSPSGALAFSVIHSLWRDRPNRKNGHDDNEIISFSKIPNCPKYPWWEISSIYRTYIQNEGRADSEFVRDGFLCNMESYGLIINSFNELEGIYVDHLKKEMGHERVWSIGPLLPPGYDTSGSIQRGGSSNVVLANKISSWLDNCDNGTVLYVCFGSQHILTKKQMEMLALGLEKSGVKFIWVIKVAKEGYVEGQDGMIPFGFEDRVMGRGLIVKDWAPQVLILRHRVIGAFLTHCGWNSIFESIVAGVPMLAWPMSADQFADATLLVDDLKVAIKVGEGDKNVADPNEFASVVAKMMSPNQVERSRAMELSKAALEAIRECGSSWKNLDEFIMHLSKEPSK